jgi:uncharacterized RDD family membrane protein YckC
MSDAGAPSPPTTTPYAGAVSRLTAYAIDSFLLSALLAGGSAVAAYLVALVTDRHLHLSTSRPLATVGLVVWWMVYFAGSWAVTGRTPGMAVFGLRVVLVDGRPATVGAAILRAATFPLSVALLGLGFLGILFQQQRRALHDLIAGTTVVYDPLPDAIPSGFSGGGTAG